jgi:hypothetical protein
MSVGLMREFERRFMGRRHRDDMLEIRVASFSHQE